MPAANSCLFARVQEFAVVCGGLKASKSSPYAFTCVIGVTSRRLMTWRDMKKWKCDLWLSTSEARTHMSRIAYSNTEFEALIEMPALFGVKKYCWNGVWHRFLLHRMRKNYKLAFFWLRNKYYWSNC